MAFLDFIKRFYSIEKSIEEKILNGIKEDRSYDLGKIWEDGNLKNLKKLDNLLIILLKIMKQEKILIDRITNYDLLKSLYTLVGDKNSLLKRAKKAQIKEIEELGPENWFNEFKGQIGLLNTSLEKIIRTNSFSRRDFLKRSALLAVSSMIPLPKYQNINYTIISKYDQKKIIEAIDYAADQV